MNVLLSIKPEFAYKIFAGTKKFEFRKTIFRCQDVRKIVVYASSPVQRVIGEFEIEEILNDEIEIIWEKTSQFSGISRQFFDTYFQDKDEAYAIKVGKVRKYNTPKLLADYNIKYAPQSFMYLSN